MNKLAALTLAAFAAFTISSTARATDLFAAATPGATPAYDDGFDWQGFYVGIYKAVEVFDSDDVPLGIGKFVGVNITASERFVLGVEGRVAAYWAEGAFRYGEAFAYGRAGFLASDKLLIYKLIGIGREFQIGGPGVSPTLWGAGVGVEWAAADNLSLRLDVQRRDCIGGCGGAWWVVQGGAAWHLN